MAGNFSLFKILIIVKFSMFQIIDDSNHWQANSKKNFFLTFQILIFFWTLKNFSIQFVVIWYKIIWKCLCFFFISSHYFLIYYTHRRKKNQTKIKEENKQIWISYFNPYIIWPLFNHHHHHNHLRLINIQPFCSTFFSLVDHID